MHTPARLPPCCHTRVRDLIQQPHHTRRHKHLTNRCGNSLAWQHPPSPQTGPSVMRSFLRDPSPRCRRHTCTLCSRGREQPTQRNPPPPSHHRHHRALPPHLELAADSAQAHRFPGGGGLNSAPAQQSSLGSVRAQHRLKVPSAAWRAVPTHRTKTQGVCAGWVGVVVYVLLSTVWIHNA